MTTTAQIAGAVGRVRRLLKVNIEGVMVAAEQNLNRLIKRRLIDFFTAALR